MRRRRTRTAPRTHNWGERGTLNPYTMYLSDEGDVETALPRDVVLGPVEPVHGELDLRDEDERDGDGAERGELPDVLKLQVLELELALGD